MRYIVYILKHILDLPITLWFNFKAFDFRTAIQLPVLVDRSIVIKGLKKGAILLTGEIKTFGIKFGTEGLDGVSFNRKGLLLLTDKATVEFQGRARISKGVTIRNTNGRVIFGDNFYANKNLTIICSEQVTFGADALLGWEVNVRDCDGHKVYVNNKLSAASKPVSIGNKVWIGSYVDIMKGSKVGNQSIVGYRSCVLSRFEEDNQIIAGYPAKVVRTNVTWEI